MESFPNELKSAIEHQDRAQIARLIESLSADLWTVVPGRALARSGGVEIVAHVSRASAMAIYENASLIVVWPDDTFSALGQYSSEELRLPHYIDIEDREDTPWT